MSSKLGEGSSGVGDHQRSPEKAGGVEYGTSCAVVWFSQRSQARVRRAQRLGALGVREQRVRELGESENSESRRTQRGAGIRDRGLEPRAKTDKLGET